MPFTTYDDEHLEHDEIVDVIAATDKSVLLEIEGEQIWFPFSQMHDDCELKYAEKGDSGVLIATRWVLKREGLV